MCSLSLDQFLSAFWVYGYPKYTCKIMFITSTMCHFLSVFQGYLIVDLINALALLECKIWITKLGCFGDGTDSGVYCC